MFLARALADDRSAVWMCQKMAGRGLRDRSEAIALGASKLAK
jgi:hypothetical protein